MSLLLGGTVFHAEPSINLIDGCGSISGPQTEHATNVLKFK